MSGVMLVDAILCLSKNGLAYATLPTLTPSKLRSQSWIAQKGQVKVGPYIPVEIRLEEYQMAESWHNEAEAGTSKGPNEGNKKAKAGDPSCNQGNKQHQGNAHCSEDSALGLGAVLALERLLHHG